MLRIGKRVTIVQQSTFWQSFNLNKIAREIVAYWTPKISLAILGALAGHGFIH